MCKLEPMGDRVAVLVTPAHEATPGGIVLPQQAQEKTNTGKVVAVGQMVRRRGSRLVIPTGLAVGDTVAFTHYTGTDLEVDGVTYKILRTGDVLARLSKGANNA